ncbi:MAG: nucleotide sugar dehydrogenase [Deltaproteobacteria bacterium]|nr:nucleotide sugar dehydrogenase [Deltaproteobacteria bacterium]
MADGAFIKKILCIGAGYVGGPTMAVLADKCPDVSVTVVDINPDRIKAWNSEELPIYEPGLSDVVKRARGRNLFFSTDIDDGIRAADIIFVSVNTPTKTFGAGAGMAADLQYWEKTARRILSVAKPPKIIVEKSTVPVRTAQAMEQILNRPPVDGGFQVLSNPEFLAEGSAVSDLLNPDRVLIGSQLTPEGVAAADELAALYARWVPREKILTCDVWSSELSKLVANAFLAQRISSVNAVSALCEKTGADVTRVAAAVGMDGRIGDRFLRAGVGFGGSCFKKDILNLVYLCRSYGLSEAADYWEQVVKINEYQKDRFAGKILAALFNTLAGKKVCLFGFAFKADTGDTRDSPAISLVRRLVEEPTEAVVTDPQALENARIDLADLGNAVKYVEDPCEAAKGAHAMAVVTDWRIYAELDYETIYKSMEKPAFVFDGRNILDHDRLYEIGFNVFPVGKPAMTHLTWGTDWAE